MVVLLVAAYFLLRPVATGATLDAVAAGLAVGFALAVKPANSLFLPAVLVALAFARRPRALGIFALRLIPSLLGLAMWKYRGLGYLPAFSHPPGRTRDGRPGSTGHQPPPLREPRLVAPPPQPRQHPRVHVEPADGLLGRSGGHRRPGPALLRRRCARSDVARLLPRDQGNVEAGRLRRRQLHDPSDRSIPRLLHARDLRPVPRTDLRSPAPARGGRPGNLAPGDRRSPCRCSAPSRSSASSWSALLPTLDSPAAARNLNANLYLPLDGFAVASHQSHRAVTLSWARQQPGGSRASYAIFRDPSDRAICVPVRHAAADCTYFGTRVAAVKGNVTSWVDHPPPGTWAYRVALSATPVGPQVPTDYILLSRPVTVTVRP